MTKYIDLSPYWKEDTVWTDGKKLTVKYAKEITGLDIRTLSGARKGFVDRAQIDTLMILLDFASVLAGKRVALEDIVRDDGK